MKKIFRKDILKQLSPMLGFLIFGVLFCVMPVKIYNFAESVLCFVLLGAGVVCIMIYSLLSSEDKIFKLMFYGIMSLVLGLFMVLVPKLFGVILSIIVGYSGVGLIIGSLKQKKASKKDWVTDFVVGIIISALAIATIVLCGTSVAKSLLAIFFGVILLINGIYSLVGFIIMLKKSKTENDRLDVSNENQSEILEIKESNETTKDTDKTKN